MVLDPIVQKLDLPKNKDLKPVHKLETYVPWSRSKAKAIKSETETRNAQYLVVHPGIYNCP